MEHLEASLVRNRCRLAPAQKHLGSLNFDRQHTSWPTLRNLLFREQIEHLEKRDFVGDAAELAKKPPFMILPQRHCLLEAAFAFFRQMDDMRAPVIGAPSLCQTMRFHAVHQDNEVRTLDRQLRCDFSLLAAGTMRNMSEREEFRCRKVDG